MIDTTRQRRSQRIAGRPLAARVADCSDLGFLLLQESGALQAPSYSNSLFGFILTHHPAARGEH